METSQTARTKVLTEFFVGAAEVDNVLQYFQNVILFFLE